MGKKRWYLRLLSGRSAIYSTLARLCGSLKGGTGTKDGRRHGGWKRYIFGRDGTARVVAALTFFLIGYFLILASTSRIGILSPRGYGITDWIIASPLKHGVDQELEWVKEWHMYNIAYTGIAIVLSSQLLYLFSIPAYRSDKSGTLKSTLSYLLPGIIAVAIGISVGFNIHAREIYAASSNPVYITITYLLFYFSILAPFIGVAYLFYLLNELYFRVVSGDGPTERERNRIMSETKSRLRRSMLVMLAGILLLTLFSLYAAPAYGENSVYPKSPNWGGVFTVYIVVGLVLAMQSWYVVCKPFYLTYSRKEGGNYETKRKITKAIPYAVFGLAVLEFAVARAGLLKYVLVPMYSLAGAISFSFPFQILGFLFIYPRARKWIGWGDLEVSVSVEFDEAAEEATVTVEQPTEADSLEVLVNGEVKKEIENPYTGDEVTVEATERDRIEVNKKKSSHRLF